MKIIRFCAMAIFWSVVSAAASATQSALDFRNQDLTNRNFIHANLSGANFSGATLKGTMFAHANLTGAKFKNAIMGNSDKGTTDFVHANLTSADFRYVKFQSPIQLQFSDISNTNFTGLDTSNMIFGPRLYFVLQKGKPNFSKTTLDCEFPWMWSQIITKGAKKPKCNFNPGEKPKENVGKAQIKETKQSATPRKGVTEPKPYVMSQPALFHGVGPKTTNTATVTDSGNAIYVSLSGTDRNKCGTKALPCHGIEYAITQCNALGTPCTVRIGTRGTFHVSETINLVNGVSLDGGYLSGTKITNAQSSIQATPSAAPLMKGAGITATLNDLLLTGPATPTYPAASAVLILTQSSNVTVTNSAIYAGTGSAAPTAAGGTVGASGENGGSYTTQTAGTSQCGNQGGAGASSWPVSVSCHFSFPNCDNSCSLGTNWSQDAFGIYGSGPAAGAPSVNPNAANACSASPNVAAASAGGNGSNASVQATPSSNVLGSFSSNGNWSPASGNNGGPGFNGSGGGGGGAGVGNWKTWQNFDCNCSNYNGTGGGGGGGGGCSATVGSGGQMGGATFAVVLTSSVINMATNVTVSGAQGGAGGAGGAGAIGGAGGTGGANCNCTLADGSRAPNCTPNCNSAAISGAGGNGGKGGDTGGGSGGNGGPSVGIVLASGSTMQKPKGIYPGSSGNIGTGGGNGNGLAPAGANGIAGLAQGHYSVPQ